MATYPSQQQLKELYSYGDGSLLHARSHGKAKAGQPVGSLNSKGYLRTSIKGLNLLVHRLTWIWHNGEIPEGLEVDHVNKVKTDNRIENLQLLDRSTHRTKDSRSGSPNRGRLLPCNVYERGGKYRAIRSGKCYGTYTTIEDALAALVE